MKVLLTAFEPFGGDTINPSLEVLKQIDSDFSNLELKKLILPTSFKGADELFEKEVLEERPDAVLSLGLAGGRAGISLERIGINLDDARIADNDGYRPSGKKIREEGPAAYFSTLPLKEIKGVLTDHGIPAFFSNTAGNFVCNHILYLGLFLAEKYGIGEAGFIHLPYLPSQVLDKPNTPSMSLDLEILAIKLTLSEISGK